MDFAANILQGWGIGTFWVSLILGILPLCLPSAEGVTSPGGAEFDTELPHEKIQLSPHSLS